MKLSIKQLVTNNGQIDGVPKNPRYIKDDNYGRLKQSLIDDPEFTDLNPILVIPYEDKYIVMGGNQRFRAAKELGWKEIEASVMHPDTPPETIRARVIKHNADYGNDDWDLLGNEWSDDPLPDWGLEQVDSFAPTLNPNAELMNTTDANIDKEEAKLIRKIRGDNKEQLSVMCPYCAEEFYVNEDK